MQEKVDKVEIPFVLERYEKLVKRISEPRGNLSIIDLSCLKFIPKRIFTVTSTPVNQERGGHAHRQTQQYLFCIEGEIVVALFDGVHTMSQTLKPGDFAFVDKMIWDRQKFLSDDSVLLVLSSTVYDESDYIRDFKEYMKLVEEKK